MTGDDEYPLETEPTVLRAEGAPLDETDDRVLDELAQLLTDVDPVPDDLVQRIRFSLALDEVYAEVARITRVPLDALAVRSDPVAGVRTETLTFSADRLTAMVTVSRSSSGEVRLDGWIAPPGAMRVQLRMQEGNRQADADAAGRFLFEGLPEGFAQLSFHVPGVDLPDEGGAVVTPLFQL
jgi:hypothetical protein